MAYAAVISLKHTIEQLMGSSSDISLVPPSSQIIESAYEEVNSLHKHLKELNSRSRKRSMKALEEEMREEVCKIEDLIESHVLNQLLSQSQSLQQGHPLSFSADLQDLVPEICTFTVALKKMKWAHLRESSNMHDDDDDDDTDEDDDDDDDDDADEDDDDDDDDDADEDDDDDDDDDVDADDDDDDDDDKPKFVGYSNQILYIKGELMISHDARTKILSLVGMAGIGKTTLAKEIFEDPDIVEHFEYRLWLRLGRIKCNYIEIARWILAQLNPDSDKLVTQGDEEISRDLQKSLESKRCFIVLDDVWDAGFVYEVVFEDKLCGCRVLLTTRLHQVAMYVTYQYNLEMHLLTKEESWDLFRAKVFAKELCPPELVSPGKKIVEKCEGLPLLIVTIANFLSKTDNSLEYWNEVAEDKQNQLLKDACKEIEEVLFPSYDHLPQHLKMCFLYMGVFRQDYEIPKSNIINLWAAEGFLEFGAIECVRELVAANVILVYQRSSPYSSMEFDIAKTCGLHSSFWHLCNREAEKNKFLHVFSNLEDCLEEGIKRHRRLCIHNNVLFGIKDVYSSIERVCASTARSLLCFGPYSQYTVPICFGLRLLKVLDALAIRFYDFPLEVLKLVLLRYLALTCNGELPPSITKLRRLQFLIVRRHMNIKSYKAPSYMPMEIWDMKELQHLQIMGSDLPDPCVPKLLLKLSKLMGVSARSCTKKVLEGIPHLRKLGILIELEPDYATEPLLWFDHISNLNELESLKCVVVNSTFITPRAAPVFKMPSSLQMLHLSGLGYSWEYMATIASLPNLCELKLRGYAFRGPTWEVQENHFPALVYLLIEDTDLVQLKVGRGSFPWLDHISLKHCYKLHELHLENCSSLEQIELVDCNPLAVNCVKQLIEDGSIIRTRRDGLAVHCSWNDRKLKSSQPTNWSKRKFLKAW